MAGLNQFTGKLGFILVAAGAAIGLGNIWRFPYLVAEYGGGIFVLIYILFIITFGFAIVAAETAIGRKTGKGSLDAFLSLGSKYPVFAKITGLLTLVISILITSYYTVIAGWIVKYGVSYISGAGELLAADGGAFFTSYIGSGIEPILWTLGIFAVVAVILSFSIQKGLQRVCVILVPALIVCMAVLAVYILTMPGGIDGLLYCFVPDFSKFSVGTVLAALGQTFFTLCIGSGAYITYGIYLSKKQSIEKSVHSIEICDTVVALLAMLLVIPIVFAFSGGSPEILGSGPGLLFEQIPQALATLGGGGTILGAVFFLILFIAALTSLFVLIEVPVAVLISRLHLRRVTAVMIVSTITALLSLVVNFGYSIWKDFTIFGNPILDSLDMLVSNILMPISALFCCILIGWMMDIRVITDEMEENGQKFRWKKFFVIMIKYVAPVCILAIMISSVVDMFI